MKAIYYCLGIFLISGIFFSLYIKGGDSQHPKKPIIPEQKIAQQASPESPTPAFRPEPAKTRKTLVATSLVDHKAPISKHSEYDLQTFKLTGNCRECNLQGVDLSMMELAEVDLSGSDLRGAIFRGSNLYSANFRNALLDNADLSGANLLQADFTEASLLRANLSQSELTMSDLSETDLSHANFSYAILRDVHLDHAYFNETQMIGADMSGSDFAGASIIVADFKKSVLTGSKNLPYRSLGSQFLCQSILPDGTTHTCQ